ncbi:MAG TPA: TIGR03364 family FAD-dependent oxidoreductase [Chitinophagaceae bacterium]|nr:TIGR03364 family FAD-dependent oxidoreductase [Chitinophagaceae bacterium]
MHNKSAIIAGAGIVGLAMARSLAERGYSVTVFERNEKAVGASIRNFGMIWPVGQPNGLLYERALQSKSIWKKVCNEAGLWSDEVGSLHLAYNDLEYTIMEEFATVNRNIRPVAAISAAEALQRSAAVNPEGLKGALWSADEMIVESRVAIEKLPGYLTEKYGVEFYFNTAITAVQYPAVFSGRQSWSADEIYICSGADFETLYPGVFAENNFTKCKLQMMRIEAQEGNWRIGPSLCGGLSLIHYKAFEAAQSLPLLRQHYHSTLPEYIKWGIHVMVSQNGEGELTIGDSHEYGLVHDPFDRQYINKMIVDYLKQFAVFKSWNIAQSWNGTYPKKTDSKTEFIYSPEDGVTIVNGIGGAGMTLSFGLAEEIAEGRL